MKGMQMKAVWVAGLAAVMAAAPASVMMLSSAPATAATPASVEVIAAPAVATVVEPAPATGIDPVVRRAAADGATAAPVAKVQASGTDNGGKCIVKSFQPNVLKSFSYKPVVFQQSKLICTGTVGTSEILIEQNDQIVVAGTTVNNQTNVTLNSLMLAPNKEQWDDAFCSAVARQAGSNGSFGVVAQDCAPLSNFGGPMSKGKGRGW